MKIVIGYNRSTNNNHIDIIKALTNLEGHYKDKLFLVLPFAYGNVTEQYISDLTNSLDESGIEYKIATEYLGGLDLAALRLVGDMFIHLPDSDALSNSLGEILYANRFVITGAWLPYSLYRSKSDRLIEIQSLDDLNNSVKEVVLRLDSEVLKKPFCNEKLRELALSSVITKWTELYE